MSIIKNQSVKKQIKTILNIVMVLDILFYLCLFLFKQYGFSVISGIILGSGYGMLNFIFISISMEKLITVPSEKVKSMAVMGYIARYLLMGVVIIVAMKNSCYIDVFSFVISLFFYKLAIFVQAIFNIG